MKTNTVNRSRQTGTAVQDSRRVATKNHAQPDRMEAPNPSQEAWPLQGRRVADRVIEVLKEMGVQYVFGTPGSNETELWHALATSGVAVNIEQAAGHMADGYQQAMNGTRAPLTPAVVVTHGRAGGLNMLAALSHMSNAETPLLVLAGNADSHFENTDAHNALNVKAMFEKNDALAAKQVFNIRDTRTVETTLREAYKASVTAPFKPVVVVLHQDLMRKVEAVLDQETTKGVRTASKAPGAGNFDSKHAEQISKTLREAKNPLIIFGDGVARDKAQELLVQLAESTGSKLIGAMNGQTNVPLNHPLFTAQAPFRNDSANEALLNGHDAVLIVGTPFPVAVWREQGVKLFDEGTQVFLVNPDPSKAHRGNFESKNIKGTPAPALGAILEATQQNTPNDLKSVIAERRARISKETETARAALDARFEQSTRNSEKLMWKFSNALMEELNRRNMNNVVFVNDGLSNGGPFSRSIQRHGLGNQPGSVLSTTGPTTGIAIPYTVGAALARPGALTIGVTGEFGAEQTEVAMDVAKRRNLNSKFIVVDDGRMSTVIANDSKNDPNGQPLPAFTMPERDWVMAAQSRSVAALRVTQEEDIQAAVQAMLDTEGPFVVHLKAY